MVRVLNGPVAEGPPGHLDAGGGQGPRATLDQVWTAMAAGVSAVLDGTTIAHLLTGDLPPYVQGLLDGPGSG